MAVDIVAGVAFCLHSVDFVIWGVPWVFGFAVVDFMVFSECSVCGCETSVILSPRDEHIYLFNNLPFSQ